MTRREAKAHHRGRHAAFVAARGRGETVRCEYRSALMRRRWHEGYAEQEAAAATASIMTAEQVANREGVRAQLAAWLSRPRERTLP
jgi:hypothetical protein